MIRTKPERAHTPGRIRSDDGRELIVPDEMTLEEFKKFPWPEGQRWELIWGTPVMSPAPQPPHQDLLYHLNNAIHNALEARPEFRVYAGVDVTFPDAQNYLCPDISVFEDDGTVDFSRGPLHVVPRLLVEALSPGTMRNDLGSKLEAYTEAGVPEYWIANPNTGALSVYVRSAEGLTEQVADSEGYVPSPLLGLMERIRRIGTRFRVDTKPAQAG
jgi:Uma2 family endonuclease